MLTYDKLSLGSLTLLDELLLAKGLLDTLALDGLLKPRDDKGVLLAHLLVNDKSKGPVQGSSDADIRQTQLLCSDPVATSEVALQVSQRPLQLLQVLLLNTLIKRRITKPRQNQLDHRTLDLPISKANPLPDSGALDRRGPQQLRRRGPTLGDVLRDGVGFDELGPVGAFEGGDFAEGEFGEVFRGAVVGADLEGGGLDA